MKNNYSTNNKSYSLSITTFYIKDLFVYLALILFIGALFLCFLLPKKQVSSGFTISISDQIIFTLSFDDLSVEISDDYLDKISIDKKNKLITIYHSTDKSTFNVIAYDDVNKSVVMKQSTCSATKECVQSPAISSSGMIYCAPHNLKILPLLPSATPPTTGGAYAK